MSNRALGRAEAAIAAAKRRRRLEAWLPWMVVVALFAVWEIVCEAFNIPEFILPAPHDIVASMIKWWRPLLEDSLQTLFTTVIGFGFAIIGGLLLGIAIGSSTLVYTGLYPLLIAFNSIPKVAVVPVLISWFGIGI